jgi:UDP-N-acetylglucosamine 4,6-dehydratase/5-epimerase
MRVTDLARAMAPEAELRIIGIRPGEKLHEEMISASDARSTLDLGDRYVIEPELDFWQRDRIEGRRLPDGFSYASDSNDRWLTVDELRSMVADV